MNGELLVERSIREELAVDLLEIRMLDEKVALDGVCPGGENHDPTDDLLFPIGAGPQEVRRLAIAYERVRLHMQHVAHREGVTPTRIGFRHTLLLLRGFWQLTAWVTAPGNLLRRLEGLHQEVVLLVLPPRRPRRDPCAVEIRMRTTRGATEIVRPVAN